MKHNILLRILFRIVAIFMLFDGIRSNLLYGGYFSVLREACVFWLFMIACLTLKGDGIKQLSTRILILFYGYYFIIGLLSMSSANSLASFIVFYKPFYFLILSYVFFHYEKLTGESYQNYLFFILKAGVFFVILNEFLYFYELPIWKNYRPWWGRFGCGYPTMDVISLSYGVLILLFGKSFPISNFTRSCYFIILITGIFLQFTGTGILLLSILLLLSLYLYIKNKSTMHYLKYVFIFVIIVASTVPSYFILNYPEEVKDAQYLLENKVSILLNKEVDDNSMDIRSEQFRKNKEKYQETTFDQIIGIGLSRVTYGDEAGDPNYIFIEDQYSFYILCCGYIGFCLFLFFLYQYVLNSFNLYVYDKNVALLTLFVAIVFILNGRTLLSLVLFPNVAFWSLFYAIQRQALVKRFCLLKGMSYENYS